MKKLTILFILLSVSGGIFSQQTAPAPTLTKHDYLKKSKNQKTAAWILAGVGSLSTLLGTIQVNPDYGENNNNTFFLVGGLVTLGASVPLFVASAKNKKKAMSLSFKNENIQQLLHSGIVSRMRPSLSLNLSL